MPCRKLKEYLDSQNIKYVSISHSVAYTAQEIASLAHIPGRDLAKTVIVRIGGDFAMAVVPASMHVDLMALQEAAGAPPVVLASEWEFRDRFPDCEPGAMPPFGSLYGMDVFVDEALTRETEIAFNAGTHRELVRLAYSDFARLVRPKVVSVGRHAARA